MWWLVSTSPPDETKLPDPPLLKRTDAFWTRSNQALSRSKPYFFWRTSRGGLVNSHMPSSEYTVITGPTAHQRKTPTVTAIADLRCMTGHLSGRVTAGRSRCGLGGKKRTHTSPARTGLILRYRTPIGS